MAVPRNVHMPPGRTGGAPNPAGRTGGPPSPAGGVRETRAPDHPLSRAGRWLRRHGKKLWWMHSLYALAFGVGVVFFARQGFEHARWLAVTAGCAWLLLVVFYRVFAGHAATTPTPPAADASATKRKIRFFVMTYVLKNLYQGMLFFLLPFYWKAATFGAKNFWFVLLLGACALLSTLDLVFDRVLMRFRVAASIFHGITLFGCLNLVIPALFPNTRTLWALLFAAALTGIGFWTIHVRAEQLRKWPMATLVGVSIAAGIALTYALRTAIPPVPMYLSEAAVGPSLLSDGRLAMQVTTLHASALADLIAVTDVVVPGGKGDRLVHVWRKGGADVYRAPEAMSRVRGPQGTVRLRSTIDEPSLPEDRVGSWSVDVETDDGQLVGRVPFGVVAD